MYYLSKGAGLPWLATLFAVFTACAAFGIGNMTQANATAKIFESTFQIPTHTTGIILTLLTGLVIIGGIKTIGKFTSFLVPFMITAYVGCSIWVLASHIEAIPHAFGLIFIMPLIHQQQVVVLLAQPLPQQCDMVSHVVYFLMNLV